MVMLIAGTVKGLAGFGLPTIGISLLVLFFPPHQALGLIVLPLFFSNLLQAVQSGQPRWVISNFWPFLLSITVTIFVVSLFASLVNERVIYVLIALGIGLFLLSQKKLPKLDISHQSHRFYASVAGAMAGVLGGLTTAWGPPTIIYLRVLGLKKEEFVRAAGWMFLFGGLPLLVGYWMGGIFTAKLIPAGLVGSLLAMIGVTIGKHYRSRLSERWFVLGIDILLGLTAINLLVKAAGY